MANDDEIGASALRAAKRALDGVRRAISAASTSAVKHGSFGGSRHYLHVKEICIEHFRKAADAAAVRIAEIAGEEATKYSRVLQSVLEELQKEVGRIFEFAPGRPDEKLKQGLADELLRQMAECSADTVADLQVGIAGGTNVRKHKPVNIDNRGGAGQIVIDSTNVNQSIGGDVSVGFNLDELLAALSQIRSEVGKSDLDHDLKAELEDAVVSIEREAKSPTPDSGRIARWGRGLWQRLEQVGLGVAASLIAPTIQALGN